MIRQTRSNNFQNRWWIFSLHALCRHTSSSLLLKEQYLTRLMFQLLWDSVRQKSKWIIAFFVHYMPKPKVNPQILLDQFDKMIQIVVDYKNSDFFMFLIFFC